MVVNGKAYVGTGLNDIKGTNKAEKDFWEYDPAVGTNGTWTQTANFGGGEQYGAVGFSIGSKGYIGTGANSSSYLKDFWEYDSGQELLYGNFTGAGIWQWNGTTWTQVTTSNPQLMVTWGLNLYGSFVGAGIWKWDGTNWSQVTSSNPQLMSATDSLLYGAFAGGGIWQWYESSWTQLTTNDPVSMVSGNEGVHVVIHK